METQPLTCDVLVAGGGPAGVAAALAAARCGARVVLCQDRPVLGGNASSEVRMHIVGANGTGSFDRGRALETEAREGGIIEEIRLENCVRNPQRSASMFDLILYDLCRREANLQLLLNTTVVGAQMGPPPAPPAAGGGGAAGLAALGIEPPTGWVEAVVADRQSTETRFVIRATTYLDCTGDGRLGVEAGAAFLQGREDTAQFGESLAQPLADRFCLGSTILLQARKHPQSMPFEPPSWVRTFTRDELRLRLYACPGEEEPTHEYGYWWAEWGGTLDTVRDNEAIRDELLAITLGIWNHIKNGPPGTPPGSDPFRASRWALDWIGFLPGKRESRRFVGQHVLTEGDLLAAREFTDKIAYGGWSLDLHPPEGVDAPDEPPCRQHPLPHLYDIPLRVCQSHAIGNLMFAGRNISATHVAFASTRVMATCAAVGQGVGTAAALACRAGVPVWRAAADARLLARIQQQLLRDDAYLIGIAAEQLEGSPAAAVGTLTASSCQPGGPASAAASGQTRAVHGPRGARPELARAGTHRWMSDPARGLPAWLQWTWPVPRLVGEVQLVFDTGLHRHLTLSHHDGYTARMHWGTPQPETVTEYQLLGRTEADGSDDGDGQWKVLADVRANFQRLRRHAVPPQALTAIRVLVTATGGLNHARICEFRVE